MGLGTTDMGTGWVQGQQCGTRVGMVMNSDPMQHYSSVMFSSSISNHNKDIRWKKGAFTRGSILQGAAFPTKHSKNACGSTHWL